MKYVGSMDLPFYLRVFTDINFMNMNFIMKPKFYIPSTIYPKKLFVTFWFWADGGQSVIKMSAILYLKVSYF